MYLSAFDGDMSGLDAFHDAWQTMLQPPIAPFHVIRRIGELEISTGTNAGFAWHGYEQGKRHLLNKHLARRSWWKRIAWRQHRRWWRWR